MSGWLSVTGPSETASRLRGRIESILDWASVRGYREGENPALARPFRQAAPAPTKVRKVQHHAVLPHNELPDFMAARTGEVIGARWGEIKP